MEAESAMLLFFSAGFFDDLLQEFLEIVDIERKRYFGFLGQWIENSGSFFYVYFHILTYFKKLLEKVFSIFRYYGYVEFCRL